MMELNNIPKSGTYAEGVDRHNDNYSKINLELKTIREIGKNEKGYFETLASLQAKYPSPLAGWQAYVADAGSSTGYRVAKVANGAWVVSAAEAPAVGVDLAGYARTGGSEKTVKEVEVEIAQLAGKTDVLSTDIKAIKENMSSLAISCFYASIQEMQADSSPTNQNTGDLLIIGELAAISNPDDNSDPDNGKIYAWLGSGEWRYMGKLESIASMQFTDKFFDTI